jgi:hypothetical protein
MVPSPENVADAQPVGHGAGMRTGFHATAALVLVLGPACSTDPGSIGEFGNSAGGAESTSGTSGTLGTSNGAATSSAVTGEVESTAGTTSPSAVFDVGGGPDLGSPGDPIIPETCAQAESGDSTVGCLFYAVDLDQASDSTQFAVAISNVQLDGAVEIVIEQQVAGAWQVIAGPGPVDPLALAIYPLPENHQEGSGIREGGTYRITADRPIVAYQFNPLFGGSFTSDASMLYPVPSLDTLSYVPNWGEGNGNAYISFAAVEDGTAITVTPTVQTAAGPGVPAGTPGEPFEIMLDEGDVANVHASVNYSSLGGTRVESDRPIVVFSGHQCALVLPDNNGGACDHLEEQISGVRLWGKNFVASRMPVRLPDQPESSLWQIVASEDDTEVTLSANAAVTGLPNSPTMLDAGGVLEFYAAGSAAHPGDFIITSDKPIAVINLMSGSTEGGGVGDPAMVQLSPAEQFLPRYVVLVPDQWETDVFVITRPAGAVVELDGVEIDDAAFIDVDDGDFEVARVVVADGVHTLESAGGFSVVVVGYDEWDSYAYLGGSGTGVINPNPAG